MADIHVSKENNVMLLIVTGRIDSSNAHALGEVLNSVVDEGALQIAIDLSGLDYMSSAGLRELVSGLKRVRRSNGDIRLAEPSERVREVLEMAGLDTIFQVFPSKPEALKSY